MTSSSDQSDPQTSGKVPNSPSGDSLSSHSASSASPQFFNNFNKKSENQRGNSSSTVNQANSFPLSPNEKHSQSSSQEKNQAPPQEKTVSALSDPLPSTEVNLQIIPQANDTSSTVSFPLTVGSQTPQSKSHLQTPSPTLEITVNDSLLKSTEQVSLPPTSPSSLPQGRLPVGTKIGHFRITKFIGGGGMGRVYEGIDEALDRKVAIKVLPQQRAQDRMTVARFLNEARSAARLNHEHIAQVYFCGEENGIPYIAFEYVEGVNLRIYVTEHGKIPLYQALNFLLQISSALSHASSHGVTHRDIKPSNILITPQGTAKLIDLGLARLLRTTVPEDELTVSGVTLGTFDYISPEQARDPRNADVRSDIYSLGCTLFFMLSGQPPYPEGTVLQKLLQHQGDAPPDLREFVPETPPEMVAIIQKMMAKAPKDRYQTPDDLIKDVIQVAKSVGITPSEATKIKWEHRSSKRLQILRHSPWIAAIFLLGLITASLYFISNTVPKRVPIPQSTPTLSPVIPSLPAEHSQNLSGEGAGNPSITSPSKLPTRLLTPADQTGLERELLTSSDEINSFLPWTSRQWGGLGGNSLSSRDLLTAPALQNQPINNVKAIAQTLGSPMDAPSGSWSIHRRQQKSYRSSVSESPAFPEGTELVVDGLGKNPGRFVTLEEAISYAAKQGNNNTEKTSFDAASPQEKIVKLAVNGPTEVSSLTLTNIDCKITAATGFSPEIVFRPLPDSETAETGSLFNLSDSHLTLENLAVRLDLASQEIILAKWSLGRLSPQSSLTLKNSTMTINNAKSVDLGMGNLEKEETVFHPNVSFFRCEEVNALSSPSSFSVSVRPQAETVVSSLTPDTDSAAVPEMPAAAITLESSFLRGEAKLVEVRSVSDVSLKILTSSLNITGPFLSYEDESSSLSPPRLALSLNLNRVLGVLSAPLTAINRLVSDSSQDQTKIIIEKSLLKTANQPLLETTGKTITPSTTSKTETVPFSASALAVPPPPQIQETCLLNFQPLDASSAAAFSGIAPSESASFSSPTVFQIEDLEKTPSEWEKFRKIPPHQASFDDFIRLFFQPLATEPRLKEFQTVFQSLENDLIVPSSQNLPLLPSSVPLTPQ